MRRAQRLESLGTLAGGIAHDFNNILTSVIGFSEMALQDCTADEPLHEDLTHILKAGKRASQLVRQILTFSRQIEGERGPIALHFLLKEALELLGATLPPMIEVAVDVNKDTPSVFARPVLTGTELAREVSKLRPKLPIILMTGFTDTEALNLEGETSLRALLKYPLSIGEIAETLRAIRAKRESTIASLSDLLHHVVGQFQGTVSRYPLPPST